MLPGDHCHRSLCLASLFKITLLHSVGLFVDDWEAAGSVAGSLAWQEGDVGLLGEWAGAPDSKSTLDSGTCRLSPTVRRCGYVPNTSI